MADTGARVQEGVSLFSHQLIKATKWVFHEQRVRDHGTDATVELADEGGRPDAGRCAVQIKAGPFYFSKPKKSRATKSTPSEVQGWWFLFNNEHYLYWVNHPLPVYVALVNLDTETIHWQRISPRTCVSTGKGWKVLVPPSNGVQQIMGAWRIDAEAFRAVTKQGHAQQARLAPLPTSGP